MSRHHGQHGYGPVTRLLHWLVALLVLATALRGLTMVRLPATTEAEVAAIFGAYSLHKTLGIAALGLIFLRLLTRLFAGAPGPLHPERRAEVFLARLTHLTLWGGMIVLPVSGWLRHATAPDLAPILWPFGQHLPGLAQDEALSGLFQTIHRLAGWILATALALHILGTVKHALFDRDATLARMTTGHGPYAQPGRFPWLAALAALLIWGGMIGGAALTAPRPAPDPFTSDPVTADPVTADPFTAAPEGFEADSAPAAPTPAPAAPEPAETIDMPPPPAD